MSSGIFTGIDIGAESVKIVSLRRRKSAFQVLGAGISHLPSDLPAGDGRARVVGETITRLFKSQKIPIGQTVLGLNGKGSLIRYMTLPVVPPWKLGMLVSYEVQEHAGAAGEIAFDYALLDLPGMSDAEFYVMVAQAHADTIKDALALGRASSIRRIRELDTKCIGPFNLFAVSPQCKEDETSLLLDIGAEETILSVQRGDALYFARCISGAARRVTTRLQRDFDISDEAAEELKRESGVILGEGADADDTPMFEAETQRISDACRAEVQAIVSGVQSSLVFFRNQVRKSMLEPEEADRIQPGRILVTGGGSLLSGLPEFLGQRLRCPCERLDIPRALPARRGSAEIAFSGDLSAHFATAAGLALSRARSQGTGFNILTHEEQDRRFFWDRTVFVAAAGAAALLLLALMVFDSYREVETAQTRKRLWEAAVKDAEETEKEYVKTRETNIRLREMVYAMEVRWLAGQDVLQGLAVLRRNVPEDIFFISFESRDLVAPGRVAAARPEPTPGRGRGRGENGGKTKADAPRAQQFHRRSLWLTGYCLASDKQAASRRVTQFADKLQKQYSAGLFSRVEQRSGAWEEDADRLQAYFENRLVPGKTPAAAFRFEIECFLREWR